MEQVNTYTIYSLGASLEACVRQSKDPILHWGLALMDAMFRLTILLNGTGSYQLNESRDLAKDLLRQLDAIYQKFILDQPGSLTIGSTEQYMLGKAVAAFQSGMELELGRAPIFFVTPKGIYDTARLINDAQSVFGDVVALMPAEAADDTGQAGRCLAFSLPTAAGFHIARATEAVIRAYMDYLGCDEPTESQRNWGRYIAALEKAGADARIVHHLEQIKDLHRNPLVHPEQSLTMIEAQSLFSMCVSVINAMMAEMTP